MESEKLNEKNYEMHKKCNWFKEGKGMSFGYQSIVIKQFLNGEDAKITDPKNELN